MGGGHSQDASVEGVYVRIGRLVGVVGFRVSRLAGRRSIVSKVSRVCCKQRAMRGKEIEKGKYRGMQHSQGRNQGQSPRGQDKRQHVYGAGWHGPMMSTDENPCRRAGSAHPVVGVSVLQICSQEGEAGGRRGGQGGIFGRLRVQNSPVGDTLLLRRTGSRLFLRMALRLCLIRGGTAGLTGRTSSAGGCW